MDVRKNTTSVRTVPDVHTQNNVKRQIKDVYKRQVITHYDTFIHTGCKVPWALPRGSPRVMRSLRRPLPNIRKLSAPLSNVRHGRLLFCETAPSVDRKKTDFFLSFGYVTKVLYRSDLRSYAVYVRTKKSIPPFLRYVRTRRNVVKPIYIRTGYGFNSHESPHPAPGRVCDFVGVFQIVAT